MVGVDGQMHCAVVRKPGPMLMDMRKGAETCRCHLSGISPIETACIVVDVSPAL